MYRIRNRMQGRAGSTDPQFQGHNDGIQKKRIQGRSEENAGNSSELYRTEKEGNPKSKTQNNIAI